LLVIAQAVCVAALFGFDHIVGAVSSNHGYTPFSAATAVTPDTWDATTWYAPAARRLGLTGDVVSGDLGGSSFDNFVPAIPTIVVGGLGRAFGLARTWMVAQSLLAALAFVLVYWLARRYTGSRVLASLVGWATLLVPFGVREIFLLDSQALDRSLEFVRMFQPAFSFPLLLVAAIAIVGVLERRRRWWLPAGIACGALAHVYYFAWVAALGALLLLVAAAWSRWRGLALAVGVALIVDVPYFVLTAGADPKGKERALLIREGGVFTHRLSGKHVALFLVLLVVLAAYAVWSRGGRRGEPVTAVLLAMLVAAAGGMSLQLVTGYDPLGDHFVLRILKPVGFLLAALLVVRLPWPRRFATAAGVAAIVGLAALGFLRQYESTSRALAAFATDTPRMQVMRWLRGHTSPDDVVATTDRRFIAEIPAISGNRLFVPAGLRTHASNDEILLRYLVAARLAGLTWPQVASALQNRVADPVWKDLSWTLFVSDYGYRAGLPARALPLWRSLDVRRELHTRRLDYLVRRGGKNAVFRAGPWSVVRVGNAG
jgi:hypothetical protein